MFLWWLCFCTTGAHLHCSVNISEHLFISLMLISRLFATSVVCTDNVYPRFSTRRRRKMTRPTLRSATKQTNRQRRRPASQWRTVPTLPCLQWRHRSVDRGSPQEGGWGSRTRVSRYNGRAGGLHKQWAHFHFTLGVGESSWTQTPVIV